MQFSKAWETYESDKRIEGFSPQTLKAYRLQAVLLIRYFNDVDLETITTFHLKKYLAKSSENLKPSSLAHRIRFIKSLFRWSHEEGHIIKNHAAKLKESKVGKRIPKFLSEREIEFLREACNSSMEKPYLNLCFQLVAELVKLYLYIKIALIGQIDQQLFVGRVIKKGRFILIFVVKFGLNDT